MRDYNSEMHFVFKNHRPQNKQMHGSDEICFCKKNSKPSNLFKDKQT